MAILATAPAANAGEYDDLIADVEGYAAETHEGSDHVRRWKEVLTAFGVLDEGHDAMTAAEAQTYADRGWSRWVPVVAALRALEQDTTPDPPVMSIAAGADITEGGDATFTLTASPAPASSLAVSVTVATSGDYGVSAGSRTVTVPSTGSATLTLSTTGDATDEPDGSVRVTVVAGNGYTVGASASGTIVVRDDDDAISDTAVTPELVAKVRSYAAETHEGQTHVDRWKRVLAAFGDTNGYTAMTAAEAQAFADRGWTRWDPVAVALREIESTENIRQPQQDEQDQDQHQTLNEEPPLISLECFGNFDPAHTVSRSRKKLRIVEKPRGTMTVYHPEGWVGWCRWPPPEGLTNPDNTFRDLVSDGWDHHLFKIVLSTSQFLFHTHTAFVGDDDVYTGDRERNFWSSVYGKSWKLVMEDDESPPPPDPSITLSADKSVDESGGSITVTVDLGEVKTADVTVGLSTKVGTACGGETGTTCDTPDYVQLDKSIVTITAGQRTGTKAITINDDTERERHGSLTYEDFSVYVASVDGVDVTDGDEIEIRIQDNDRYISFESRVYRYRAWKGDDPLDIYLTTDLPLPHIQKLELDIVPILPHFSVPERVFLPANQKKVKVPATIVDDGFYTPPRPFELTVTAQGELPDGYSNPVAFLDIDANYDHYVNGSRCVDSTRRSAAVLFKEPSRNDFTIYYTEGYTHDCMNQTPAEFGDGTGLFKISPPPGRGNENSYSYQLNSETLYFTEGFIRRSRLKLSYDDDSYLEGFGCGPYTTINAETSARLRICVTEDKPEDNPHNRLNWNAKQCTEATTNRNAGCGPGGNQIIIHREFSGQQQEDAWVDYWFYPSFPPTSGNVKVRYDYSGYYTGEGKVIDVPVEGIKERIQLTGSGDNKSDGDLVLKFSVIEGTTYQVHPDDMTDTIEIAENDLQEWMYIKDSLGTKIEEGSNLRHGILAINARKTPSVEPGTFTFDLNVEDEDCTLVASEDLLDASTTVGEDDPLPCFVDLRNDNGTMTRDSTNLDRFSFDLPSTGNISTLRTSFMLKVGHDSGVTDDVIRFDPQITYDGSSGGVRKLIENFPYEITVFDDDVLGQDDVLSVCFSRDQFDVNEANGPLQPVVTWNNEARHNYRIPVTITSSEAVEGEDWDSGRSYKHVEILAGDVNSYRNNFDVVLLDNDDASEEDEALTLTLGPFPEGTQAGNLVKQTINGRDKFSCEVATTPPDTISAIGIITDDGTYRDEADADAEADAEEAEADAEEERGRAQEQADIARNARCHPVDDPDTPEDESAVVPVDDPTTPDVDESDCVANIKMELVTTELVEYDNLTIVEVDGSHHSRAEIDFKLTSDLDFSGDVTLSINHVEKWNRLSPGLVEPYDHDVSVELSRGVTKTVTSILTDVILINDFDFDGTPTPPPLIHNQPDGHVSVDLKDKSGIYTGIESTPLPQIHIKEKDPVEVANHVPTSDFLDNEKEGPDADIIFNINYTSADVFTGNHRLLREYEWIEIPIEVRYTTGRGIVEKENYEITAFQNQENLTLRQTDTGYVVRITGTSLDPIPANRSFPFCYSTIADQICLNFVSRFRSDDPKWKYNTESNRTELSITLDYPDPDEIQTSTNLSGGYEMSTTETQFVVVGHTPDSTATRSFTLSADEKTMKEPDSGYAFLPFDMEVFPKPTGVTGFAFCADGSETTASYYHDYTIVTDLERDMMIKHPDTARHFTGFAWNGSKGCSKPIYTWDRFSTFYLKIAADSHDEGAEKIGLYVQQRDPKPDGAIADSNKIVFTITNDGPMPAAWLARFGRTVAEQALDGISGRMAASRAPGMQGTLAGQALSFDPPASQPGTGDTATGARSGDREAATMTAREALLGSSFSLTGQTDGAGGTMAFWGRASQAYFDGTERGDGIALDGEVTTGMLGADYARGKWLIGLALTQSTAEGRYAAIGAPADAPASAGDGTVEASLTAAIPYSALQASERLKLWGAAGYGAGEVTLKTGAGESLAAGTTWRMAAAGTRGELLEAPAEGSGPALALTSDALWTRTSSQKTPGLAASDSDVTRLRLGLAGSYHVALDAGARLVPKLEVGVRHDGGDAETGFGVELGAGLAWSDPALGLTLDVSARTLLAHEDGDLADRGVSAALGFDPDPASERGPSLSLRQDFGGRATGGLDALFQPAPLEDRTGSEATSRWTLKAAYGLPAFGGRWTASSHAGLAVSAGARDYTLGWRWTPAKRTSQLTFGLKAVRTESDTAEPEHAVGLEAAARW